MFESILKKTSPFFSSVSLVLIILFATLCFLGYESFKTYVVWTNIATVVWFCFSPWWLILKKENPTH